MEIGKSVSFATVESHTFSSFILFDIDRKILLYRNSKMQDSEIILSKIS